MQEKPKNKDSKEIPITWERDGKPSAAYLRLYARLFADILGSRKATNSSNESGVKHEE